MCYNYYRVNKKILINIYINVILMILTFIDNSDIIILWFEGLKYERRILNELLFYKTT